MQPRVVDIAASQVGVREATGQNDGVPAERYNHGEEKAWCAAFVAWCFAQAGTPLPGNEWQLASVRYMEEQLIRLGRWWSRSPELPPAAGDIVFYADRGASDRGVGRHVGIVEKVRDGRVYTIEGNLSNAVRRTSHDLHMDKRVVGYARWGD